MPTSTRVYYTPRFTTVYPQELWGGYDCSRDAVRPRRTCVSPPVYGRSTVPQPEIPEIDDIEAVERYFREGPVCPPESELGTTPRQDRCDTPQEEETDDTPFTPINKEAYLKAKEEAHEFSRY